MEFMYLQNRLNAVILPGVNPHLDQVQIETQESFQGKRKSFTIPLHTPGTEFPQSVWKGLQELPPKISVMAGINLSSPSV